MRTTPLLLLFAMVAPASAGGADPSHLQTLDAAASFAAVDESGCAFAQGYVYGRRSDGVGGGTPSSTTTVFIWASYFDACTGQSGDAWLDTPGTLTGTVDGARLTGRIDDALTMTFDVTWSTDRDTCVEGSSSFDYFGTGVREVRAGIGTSCLAQVSGSVVVDGLEVGASLYGGTILDSSGIDNVVPEAADLAGDASVLSRANAAWMDVPETDATGCREGAAFVQLYTGDAVPYLDVSTWSYDTCTGAMVASASGETNVFTWKQGTAAASFVATDQMTGDPVDAAIDLTWQPADDCWTGVSVTRAIDSVSRWIGRGCFATATGTITLGDTTYVADGQSLSGNVNVSTSVTRTRAP